MVEAVVKKETLLEKADRIADSILRSEELRRYWQARTKMEGHKRAQELFEELKLKTNTSLILQQRLEQDHPKVMLAELEVQEVEQKLYEIPVAMQYKEAQAEVNEMLQGVISVLLSRLAPEIPVEMGPRQGCGQGHGGAGCSCGKN